MKVGEIIRKNRFGVPLGFQEESNCINSMFVKKMRDIPNWLRELEVEDWRIGYSIYSDYPMPMLILYVKLPAGKSFPVKFYLASNGVVR